MSGYGYAGANPVREVDPEGMQRRRLDPARQESGPDIAGGIGGARGDYGSRSFWDVFKGCNARPPSTGSGGAPGGSGASSSRASGSGGGSVGLSGVMGRSGVSSVDKGSSSASFLAQAEGASIVLPSGASGPTPVQTGRGVKYIDGTGGGNGLHRSVTNVRIMEPTSQSPGGYVNYGKTLQNGRWQSLDPYTGRSIGKSDDNWHIPMRLPDR